MSTLDYAKAATALLLVAVCSACGVTPSGTSRDGITGEAAPPDGVGSTLGGCPAAEPGAGSACTVPGRLCTWTRSCGAVDTGWCTSTGTWHVASGACQAGCPATPTVSLGIGGAPSSSDGGVENTRVGPSCTPGLTCTYASTPLRSGASCSCQGDGTWNSLCSSFDDGWVAAPSAPTNNCTELAACGGGSGCAESCPNAAPRECGCGPDGLLYCAIKESCGGGTAVVGGTTGN